VRRRSEAVDDVTGVVSTAISLQERRSAEGLDCYVPLILRNGRIYDTHLDRFFLDLPLNGVRSAHSLRAYGYDILLWVRFLEEARGISLWILLANTARTLHVGILADCFFDPATAVYLRHVTAGDQTAPMISLCEPTRCPNACITARHRPAWTQAADNARALLKEKRLSELQRTALAQELRRIETVLSNVADQAPHQANARD
jgi:Phage integrase, N-terminal SAM-like domain